MSNIFSSVQFHDSAFHRSDWEGLLENKKSIWIAGVCGDEMGMRRAAQIKGPQQESRRPICLSFSVLCCSDSASWNSWYQGSKTRQFLFNVYCHFWIALSGLPKKKVMRHYFPNKSAANQPEKEKTCKQLSSNRLLHAQPSSKLLATLRLYRKPDPQIPLLGYA